MNILVLLFLLYLIESTGSFSGSFFLLSWGLSFYLLHLLYFGMHLSVQLLRDDSGSGMFRTYQYLSAFLVRLTCRNYLLGSLTLFYSGWHQVFSLCSCSPMLEGIKTYILTVTQMCKHEEK